MLVNSNGILKDAIKEGYAVGAYNINNLEWAKYILEACNEDRAPVILEATEDAINYMGGFKTVSNMVKGLIEDLNIKIPVCLHLDHGKSVETCIKAINNGFTSVMIDASSKSLDENIKLTNEVAAYAHKKDVSVEAEIGSFDNLSNICQLEDCIDFVNSTLIDSLAPSIGNAHGVYKGEANLDFNLLGAICKNVKIPLVLHGSSGLDDNKIKTCIFCGVSKINVNTDFQISWSNSVRKYLENNKEVYDPRKIIASGKSAIKDLVHQKNELFGCKNKAI